MADITPNLNDSTRFSPVGPDDRAGDVWIITILCLIYSALVGITRAYIKFKMYGWDDLLIAVATILQVGQAISLFIGLSNGLGKFNTNTTPDQWATASQATTAAIILGLLALAIAKWSVLALILRIIGPKTGISKSFCIGMMGLSIAWGVGSCVAFLVDCRPGTMLTSDAAEKCPNQITRWVVITVFDIVSELLMLALVAKLCWEVTMSLKKRLQVVLAFAFRIPLIALAAAHLAQVSKYTRSGEPQFAVTNSLNFQQGMLVWSVISATIPNLKNFLKSFSMNLGLPVAFDLSLYGSSNAYPLQSLGDRSFKPTSSAAGASTAVSVRNRHVEHHEPRGRPSGWRPDEAVHETRVHGVHHWSGNSQDLSEEGRTSSRNGSEEMIITKETTWHVTHEVASSSR